MSSDAIIMAAWAALMKPSSFICAITAVRGSQNPVHVKVAARLGVGTQLGPGPLLEDLLQGPGAAGQGDEALGEVGHHGLALVHRGDHMEFGQAPVSQLPILQGLREDSDNSAARRQRGVHQTYVPAAIDDLDISLGHPPTHLVGGLGVDRPNPGTGAAEDSDGGQLSRGCHHGRSLSRGSCAQVVWTTGQQGRSRESSTLASETEMPDSVIPALRRDLM